jgi:hypothetical protein
MGAVRRARGAASARRAAGDRIGMHARGARDAALVEGALRLVLHAARRIARVVGAVVAVVDVRRHVLRPARGVTRVVGARVAVIVGNRHVRDTRLSVAGVGRADVLIVDDRRRARHTRAGGIAGLVAVAFVVVWARGARRQVVVRAGSVGAAIGGARRGVCAFSIGGAGGACATRPGASARQGSAEARSAEARSAVACSPVGGRPGVPTAAAPAVLGRGRIGERGLPVQGAVDVVERRAACERCSHPRCHGDCARAPHLGDRTISARVRSEQRGDRLGAR